MVPNGWEFKKLGLVAELQRGFDLPSAKRIEGNVPIISSGGLSGYHNESKVEPPGVVTGRYGSIGDVFYVEEDFWPLNTSLWVKNFHGNYPKYVYYLLTSFDFKKFSDKTGVPGVNRNDLHAVKVGLPPLHEQRKIAKILSTWDKAIATNEKLIETSKQQKKALMQQLLTGKKRLVNPETDKVFEGEWEEVKLASSVSLMRSGLSRKLESENVGIAVLRSNNVGERYTSNEDLKYWYLDDPQGANVRNYILDEGDILVNFINSLSQIGKTCIYKKTGDLNAIYTTNLLRLKPNTEAVTGDFLFYLTKTERYRNAVKSITKPAVNQASFTTKEFGKITFTLPALKEQQKIASVLTAADKEIEVLEAKLAHFKQEKKALMQQLLTGKRRVNAEKQTEVAV
ncbi:restriction endonuclease subunit S [Vibrio sp. ZSDZ34]|uniref:Restriction endonuclease subunit S n=1 Tax=Vibrio gelatinilyticus TaxID=2893468 RepID=A0A9X1WEK3_9VIBR|nr:restriction endonuclease subunit S [Vibrio gelatinilyticus]MCJ2375554.1 restriction endonuclease subunit S [Vibrio gelatinilyticus]